MLLLSYDAKKKHFDRINNNNNTVTKIEKIMICDHPSELRHGAIVCHTTPQLSLTSGRLGMAFLYKLMITTCDIDTMILIIL
jgi:hypothetical protein